MKKAIFAAIAATLIAGPLAVSAAEAAPQRHETTVVRHGPDGRTVVTERTVVRQHDWHRGERFDRRQAQNYRVVTDWRAQRLAPPPRGHRWVRSGRDVVLVHGNGTVVRVERHRG